MTLKQITANLFHFVAADGSIIGSLSRRPRGLETLWVARYHEANFQSLTCDDAVLWLREQHSASAAPAEPTPAPSAPAVPSTLDID